MYIAQFKCLCNSIFKLLQKLQLAVRFFFIPLYCCERIFLMRKWYSDVLWCPNIALFIWKDSSYCAKKTCPTPLPCYYSFRLLTASWMMLYCFLFFSFFFFLGTFQFFLSVRNFWSSNSSSFVFIQWR